MVRKCRQRLVLLKHSLMFLCSSALVLLCSCSLEFRRENTNLSDDLSWPTATQTNRPWSRWWWLGSAVDEPNLTRLLTQYRDAGLGGVEICPVYGVKGYEDKFIDFLSPQWIKMLKHTTLEAAKLDLGVDLTTGTGWPFGGPNVTDKIASERVLLERYTVPEGEKLSARIPKDSKARLEYLLAVSNDGNRIELTDKVKNGELDWITPAGQWTIYEVSIRTPIQKVKRAAPGGEGNVLDPYSVKALDEYLSYFDKSFAGFDGKMPRCFFHDSFEYYDASWTDDFFDKFKLLRGYDLRGNLEALFGDGPEEVVRRVKSDYRETISDLHTTYIQRWTQWCHRYGSLSRNQAHGAPANLIDLYAAADIPETEFYGSMGERKGEIQIPMLKFASSAAHLKGTTLASSESFTWLKEHFQTSLADVKSATDLLFLGGANHIFFHGITYSPDEALWPGWQFYAAVNFGPHGGLWRDLPAFNSYVTRCQSILQSGKPDENILLYMPVYDLWQDKTKLTIPLTVHNQNEWLYPSHFYDAAMKLWTSGYTFDEVSDKFLAQADCNNGKILLGGNEYDVVVIPRCRLMTVATMQKLVELAKAGANILFEETIPADVPGLASLDERRATFNKILGGITLSETSNPQVQQASLGKGRLLQGQLEAMLQAIDVPREPAADVGVRFIRRTHPEGYHYFFVNRGEQPVNQWVSLGRPARSAVLMDPQFSNSVGLAALRTKNGSTQVYLQLQPGQSVILRTFTAKQVSGSKWQYTLSKEGTVLVNGVWDVAFIEGGPDLPKGCRLEQLISWTELDDSRAKSFAGAARYTIEFDKPAQKVNDWILDLGRVCQSARIRLNGRQLGTVWCEPFQCPVGKYLRRGKNVLEIEVTNLAANRIRDMDQRKVNWKYFYDINVVNRDYKLLDASGWPLRDSGLLGPVRLIPQNYIQPDGKDALVLIQTKKESVNYEKQ